MSISRSGALCCLLFAVIVSLSIRTLYAMTDDDLNQPLHGKTFLAPRSEAVNAERELVGWHRFINQPCKEFYGSFSITPEYKHSFRPARLAEYFFAVDQLVITGSQVINRDNQTQILADYFGLPTMFQSTVRMEPEFRTGLIDFDGYFGYQDFYIRFHVPYVWTKWIFKLEDEVIAPETESGNYPARYMAAASIPAPNHSFTQAMRGDTTWGQVTRGLEFGRIDGAQSKDGFTEAQVAIGWNFVNTRYAHAGFNIRGSIPGGTPSEAVYLFEPIIGNGNHAELGIGFTGHVILWESDGDKSITFYGDSNITHLFNARQRRSFDLINPSDPLNIYSKGFGTRYILAKEFDQDGNYTGNCLPTIDVTTLYCNTSFAIQIDTALMLSYEDPTMTIDLGYSVWFRSREMISDREPIPYNTYALKGIQNVTLIGSVLSNATQSTATIYGNELSNQSIVKDPFPPVFFNDDQINEDSAMTSHSFTHKVFGNIGYSWINEVPYVDPYLGIGGEVEFEGLNPRHEIKANKNSISQWGVWIKTGVGF